MGVPAQEHTASDLQYLKGIEYRANSEWISNCRPPSYAPICQWSAQD